MVGGLNNVISVTANSSGNLIKGATGVVKAVYVTKTNSGDVAYFLDGTTNAGTTQFTVEADSGAQCQLINREFANGIFVTFTGTTAKLLIVFE